MTDRADPLLADTARERAPAPPPRTDTDRVEDELRRRGLPVAAGNHAVARVIAQLRSPATTPVLMRRRLPAETPATTPGHGSVLPAAATRPTEVAEALGRDYDVRDHATGLDGPDQGAPAAMARLDRLQVSEMLTALQILRLNGSPDAPGSRKPFDWIVAGRTAGSPRVQAAVAAIGRPADLQAATLATLPAQDVLQLRAFVGLGAWDHPVQGLPRPGSGPRVITDEQREQLEYIRRRRAVVADRGRPAVRRVGRGLEYDGNPSGDPAPTAATRGTLAAEIWQELSLEGGASAVNTYDDQKFTWGKGWSGLTHLPRVLERFFDTDPGARQELMEAGFTYRAAEGQWLFVHVDREHVLEGAQALDAFKTDRDFVNLLAHLAEDPEHRQHFVDAQWASLSTDRRAGDVPLAARRWPVQSVRFAAHCVHWGARWTDAVAAGPDIKRLIAWIATAKGDRDAKTGAFIVKKWASGTIRGFSGRVAEQQMTAPAKLPDPPDPNAFYFEDGHDRYRVWKP